MDRGPARFGWTLMGTLSCTEKASGRAREGKGAEAESQISLPAGRAPPQDAPRGPGRYLAPGLGGKWNQRLSHQGLGASCRFLGPAAQPGCLFMNCEDCGNPLRRGRWCLSYLLYLYICIYFSD